MGQITPSALYVEKPFQEPGVWIARTIDSALVAKVYPDYAHLAPLFASAQDLLTALQRVVVYIEVAGLIPPCVREARKLIAKAKGGE